MATFVGLADILSRMDILYRCLEILGIKSTEIVISKSTRQNLST